MERTDHDRLFTYENKTVWEEADKGVIRQILSYDEEVMAVRVRFDKNAVGTLHSHPHRQISYVESGRFLVEIDGESRELGAGSSFIVPPDTEHGVRALEKGSLIDFFSPAREDFL